MTQPAFTSTRRDFLKTTLVGMTGLGICSHTLGVEKPKLPADILAIPDRSAVAPVDPVAIERCRSYEPKELAEKCASAFDRIGGLAKLMSGKTVTMKVNITGIGRQRMAGLPPERSYQTHPVMVEVLCGLFMKAGAKRLVIVESFYRNREPEAILSRLGWNIDRLKSAGNHKVTFEDTRNRGAFKSYSELKVPYGGYVFGAYHLNRRYEDTDVFVSLAKLKNHVTAGVTLAIKNLFGITPTALYGNDAPNEKTTSNRGAILHFARRDVPAGVTPERFKLPAEIVAKATPEIGAYRVPRVTADVLGARPVDLAIVDGIEAATGAEGPWCVGVSHRAVKPGVLVVGTNAVTTDAVGAGIMGYDPQAAFARHPFQGENHLNLLARAGVGSNDLARIEVRGLSLEEALHEYHPDQSEPGWVKRQLLKG